ncbi:MAG: PDDEXK nuclease domain-containing protein [Treponema sp.]|jgi:predicted nuclease of restriction endonuclease-like (RecB) superfamily|nr:PDDEXK nuclease domain-containing protein [Treponema sp.]
MNFNQLITSIKQTNDTLKQQAFKAVNVGLSLRNWLIGYYIAEYELNGADRAVYGEGILEELAKGLKDVSNCNKRQLYRYLRFYRIYPQIVGTLPPQFATFLPGDLSIEKVGTPSPLSLGDGYSILERLSYSHIEQLVDIEDETKRLFYEVECIRGNWSVRELERQIASLYYERSGLSRDKRQLAAMVDKKALINNPDMVIRDPYVFEFLGLKPKEVMTESRLESQLIERLEDFLLELGNGFCFEARQKRILIGDEFYFVDLVFYHRLLKCHVLVEIKVDKFTHENIGQLNTYVSWYKQNMMSTGDNPPIGILLCTNKNHALVEYALAGMESTLCFQIPFGTPPKRGNAGFCRATG